MTFRYSEQTHPAYYYQGYHHPPPTAYYDYGYADTQMQPHQYYQSLPRNHHRRNKKLARSSSMGHLHREFEDYQAMNDQDHSWYDYEDRAAHIPHHNRRHRSRRHSNNTTTSDLDLDDIEPTIDLQSYEHLDGEPLNEREVLALKNAAINQKLCSKPYVEEKENDLDAKKVAIQENALQQENTLPEEEQPTIELTEEQLSAMLDSLTVIDSNESTTSTMVDTDSNSTATTKNTKSPSPPLLPAKKKNRWPFAFLFKKPKVAAVDVVPTKSKSTPQTSPPTPVLSPDNLTTSNISSNATPSPQHQQVSPHGVWAFRVPMTQGWFSFDNENQKKIADHVSHSSGVLQIVDSHFGQGIVPMVVLPFQRVCYYPTDITLNQLACLELCYMPNNNAGC